MLSKELFCKTMDAIIEQHKYDYEFSSKMCALFEDTSGCFYKNHFLSEATIDLLKTLMQDKNDWIGYFMYELDCGAGYKDGMITDSNGAMIKLATVSDLYELLKSNYK